MTSTQTEKEAARVAGLSLYGAVLMMIIAIVAWHYHTSAPDGDVIGHVYVAGTLALMLLWTTIATGMYYASRRAFR